MLCDVYTQVFCTLFEAGLARHTHVNYNLLQDSLHFFADPNGTSAQQAATSVVLHRVAARSKEGVWRRIRLLQFSARQGLALWLNGPACLSRTERCMGDLACAAGYLHDTAAALQACSLRGRGVCFCTIRA